jgi:DNA-directed RNA polymerase subunit E'/Rpb7
MMEALPSKLKFKKKDNKREQKINSIYSRCLIARQVTLPMVSVGKNLKETIETNIKYVIEGKCIVEGFVKVNSTKIITYSSGVISGGNILFEVVIECEVCFPVEGMVVDCVARNITKAGIRAESATDSPSPIVVFVARDHHYQSKQFSNVQEGDKIRIRVIGQRFELNDKYISIIAELV